MAVEQKVNEYDFLFFSFLYNNQQSMVLFSLLRVALLSVYFSLLLLSHSILSFFAFSLNSHYMEPLSEREEEQLERFDLVADTDLASASSGLSFVLSTDDSRSTTSSGDISASSGEIPAILVEETVVPRLVDPIPSIGELTVAVTPTARLMCVGRDNKGVTWGLTSVIGRRREMEDAVTVMPGFMSRTCDHVGGCTAPGSRSCGEISPIHFFGVYDGHGGSQVQTVQNFVSLILSTNLKN